MQKRISSTRQYLKKVSCLGKPWIGSSHLGLYRYINAWIAAKFSTVPRISNDVVGHGSVMVEILGFRAVTSANSVPVLRWYQDLFFLASKD